MWGGGESPSLPGLLAEQDIELAGAAVGAVPAGRSAILGERLAPGDEIVLVASSGLHANGASLARLVAGRLPDGYATELPAAASAAAGSAATTLGEALLEPSVMYVPLIAALLEADVELTYLSHVTGHGLLKLMRPARELSYRIERLPEVPPVLSFLVEQAGMDAQAAYSTFNMGAGFAVYCAPGGAAGSSRSRATSACARCSPGAWRRGPGRWCWSPSACASRATGSSCRPRLQLERVERDG